MHAISPRCSFNVVKLKPETLYAELLCLVLVEMEGVGSCKNMYTVWLFGENSLDKALIVYIRAWNPQDSF